MNEELNALEAIADNAYALATPCIFFSQLHKCVEFILQTLPFEKALAIIANKAKDQIDRERRACDEALFELKTQESKIRVYLVNNNMQDHRAMQLINAFESLLMETSKASRQLIAYLEQAISILLNDEAFDHSDFMEALGEIRQIGDDRYIRTEDAFPMFSAWENEQFYFAQDKRKADWFSLNQLTVFFERFDARHYDKTIIKLKKEGINVNQLQEEHRILLNWAYFGIQPASEQFPSIEEYKGHVRNLISSIKQLLPSEQSMLKECIKYMYDYCSVTGELKINSDKPIKYNVGDGPAKALQIITNCADKKITRTALFNKLGFENKPVKELGRNEKKQITEIIRGINEPFKRNNRPSFLIDQKNKKQYQELDIMISSAYTAAINK